MKILRNILGIICGYAVFVVSALLLFRLSGVKPHDDPSMGFASLTVAYGLVFSFLGGLLAQIISGSGKRMVNYLLALIIAGFATFSLVKTSGNHYSQIAAIFAFAPASVFGGMAYLKKS